MGFNAGPSALQETSKTTGLGILLQMVSLNRTLQQLLKVVRSQIQATTELIVTE